MDNPQAQCRTRESNTVRLLAHSTLLPSYISEPILAGNPPPLTEIVDGLLIHALDCEATVAGDSQSTMNERRIARACATIAFLAALAIETEFRGTETVIRTVEKR